MSLLAENKRRVLAGIATLVVLMALGFAVGRATSGPTAADAASRSAPSTRLPVASGHSPSLKADLANAQNARALTARQLANTQAANRRLRHVAANADRASARARRCRPIRAPQRLRRCVTAALDR